MAANMHNDYADRKNGRKPITYLHPDMDEVLGDTYGLMIYQESDDAGGPEVRRLLAWPRPTTCARRRARRSARSWPRSGRSSWPAASATGYGRAIGTDAVRHHRAVRRLRASTSSHAFGYGLVGYQTAWLKANYPVEYLAALLTSVKDDKDKTGRVPGRVPGPWASRCWSPTSTCRPRTSPPSAPAGAGRAGGRRRRRRSPSGCRPSATSARAWSSGSSPSATQGGPFTDFYDFCDRVDPVVLNKRTVESLIKAGAFDSLGPPPPGPVPGLRADRRPDPGPAPGGRPGGA